MKMHALFLVAVLLSGGLAYGDTFLEEHFEGPWLPAGWTTTDNAGAGWTWVRNDTTGRTNYAGGDGYCAAADSDYWDNYPYDTRLITPAFVVPLNPVLSYVAAYNHIGGGDNANTAISTDGGATWTNLLHWEEDHDAYGPGEVVSLPLDAFVGQTAEVRFRYYGDGWDWWWQVDDVLVEGDPLDGEPVPEPGALTLLGLGGLLCLRRRRA